MQKKSSVFTTTHDQKKSLVVKTTRDQATQVTDPLTMATTVPARPSREDRMLKTHFLKLHAKGIATRQDFLTEAYRQFNPDVSLINQLRETWGNVKKPSKLDDQLVAWSDLSTDFFVVRTTDPDAKELICGSIRISNDCLFELMKIESLSELLSSRIQPRQVLLEPELSNAKVIVIINGRHTYTTPTHWDTGSNYSWIAHQLHSGTSS